MFTRKPENPLFVDKAFFFQTSGLFKSLIRIRFNKFRSSLFEVNALLEREERIVLEGDGEDKELVKKYSIVRFSKNAKLCEGIDYNGNEDAKEH